MFKLLHGERRACYAVKLKIEERPTRHGEGNNPGRRRGAFGILDTYAKRPRPVFRSSQRLPCVAAAALSCRTLPHQAGQVRHPCFSGGHPRRIEIQEIGRERLERRRLASTVRTAKEEPSAGGRELEIPEPPNIA